MSDILIKGMEMPKNCDECVMRYVDHRGYIMCELTHQLVKSGAKDRYDNCPLVEIPTPHGRLADLDQIIEGYWDGSAMRIDETDLKAIEKYDVIIEAEDGTE